MAHSRRSHRPVSKLSLGSILAVMAASASPLLAADAPGVHTFHATEVLGTSMDLKVVAASQAEADTVHKAVTAEIERLRKILSTYDPESDLGKVNASREAIQVSPEVLEVLRLYNSWEEKSKGAFSAATAPMTSLWKEAQKTGQAPSPEALAQEVAAAKTGLWKINDVSGKVQRTSDRTINIDSLGKGFIVSRAIEAGQKAAKSVRGILLDIGGDVATVGYSSMTADESWQVGVADPAHPADNAAPLTVLKLSDLTVATSGHYARGFDVAGKRYSHIIDPRTAMPVNAPAADAKPAKVASATVIAPNNAAANALATTLCVLTPKEGMDLINNSRNVEALLVLTDGKQVRSNGFRRFEVSPPSEPAPLAWTDGYEVSLKVELKPILRGRQERAYVAVWIEDAEGKHISTLAEWGNGRWLTQGLSTWTRSISNDRTVINAVSRATRAAGTYTFTWDGRDLKGNGVPRGDYRVFVEVSYEHNGHTVSSAIISCDGEKAETKIEETQHIGGAPVVYDLKKK